ncbi:hypothetical protein ALI144C_07360 [Actinosynnema sp. ALI-1.44]|uniref:DUF6262 family protein n=1 Tax=Actinosynnema sp. ALI-1.44 TaxID=1933779 RepID=UPI00097C81EC|nr:DUF6262 family protein [Actinosynnema sp. ALI-1.44]ONI88256.1 hypothetical protein ALI144C_07360 [Actinosynnema sp. ALI-1.44]
MSTPPATTRTAAALDARRSAVEKMLDRIRDTLRRMQQERAKITVAAVARGADVSRTFLYQNPAARQLVDEAATAARGQRVQDQAEHAAGIAASWRERALNAEDALRRANDEISLQRTTIGQHLGKIRDLEQDLPEDGIQRIVTENTTLKQKFRQLTQDNRRLQERLQGARNNTRFLDKRVADLETQLLPETGLPVAAEADTSREISRSNGQ